jgi:tetratricopeptide (TPR) repeat protein
MRSFGHRVCGLSICALLGAGADLARAQPVLDLALSDAQAVARKGCAILKVNFNIRIRYASHFPLDRGEELRISINPIDRDQAIALQLLKREAVRPPDSKLVGIKAIDFETRQANGSVLRILFDRPVAYQVAQSADVQSIVVAIAGVNPSAACKPEYPGDAPGYHGAVPGAAAGRPADNPPGKISEADLRSAAAAMDEARAAIKTGNFDGAIRLLGKVIKLPENEYSAEAHELMGLARQRSGQIAAARSEYESYLSRYPNHEGNERVRQRLEAIITANGEPSEKLRTATNQPGFKRANGFGQSGETTWTFSGSASQFYIRDDSFRTAVDPSVAPDPNADADSHRVHQNESLSSLDVIAAWANDQARGKIRFSGTGEHHFDSGSEDRLGIAALFSDVELRDWNVLGRVGRQTRSTGGVLGRFDGGLVSWQAVPYAKFNLVGGSPLLSRFDLPFRDQKYFYGASVDLGPFLGGFETTLFAIEQRDRSLLDRQAVGAEFRYFDQTKSMFSTVDYDVHFQKLNAAIFTGSWTLPDQSTIYGGADYRRTPYLSTWNALLNQPFTTLYDMLRLQSQSSDQLKQLAIDQTPVYKSAMIGASHPLSDHFQVSADATVVNLTQSIALPGIDPALGTLPAGNEYYYSTQLMGSNLIKDGDMYIAGLRYSQLLNSNLYVLDFNTRYPLWSEFSVSPRLRLGYRAGRGIDLQEYTALPSVLIDYYWTKELSSEFELGAQRTWSRQDGVRDNTTELFLTLGVRYDFYADDASKDSKDADKRKCATPAAAALCRYSNSADKSACAAPPTTSCR